MYMYTRLARTISACVRAAPHIATDPTRDPVFHQKTLLSRLSAPTSLIVWPLVPSCLVTPYSTWDSLIDVNIWGSVDFHFCSASTSSLCFYHHL